MKKLIIISLMALFITGISAAQVSRGGTLYVSVKNLPLKASTGWFARTNGTLEYGDRVTVIQVSGNYVEVRSAANSSLTGWTSSSNFSTRQVVSGTSSTATQREMALAGKGFNEEVERSYRTGHRELNYNAVDIVETITVSEDDLKRFLEEGRLFMGDN